ncbi:RPII140-upstream gene protein-like [Daphnia pulex]|uniref:RPII140-upstream gene protein-like n=1 Tax=Daphnia pulex TaxID=6669 RepID=UPI001EE0FE6F|nr:RPII140-upstream gene protein-like [Daphnia pulex]
MWRRKIPIRLGLSIFGVEILSNNDIIDPTSLSAQKLAEEARRTAENETGWDRLKAIFKTDEFNSVSPELDSTFAAAAGGLLAGMIIGGIPASKLAHEDFITRNKASTFENHIEAKSKLQFNVTRAMAVGGWRVGWRLALFTGGFTFFTTAVSTYRNKSSIFEFSAGGLLAGSMYKFTMGPKAMVAGGLAGGVLGTVAGAVTVGLLKLTGTTTEELRYWRKGWKESQNREVTVGNPKRKETLGTMGIMHDLSVAMKAHLNESNESDEENEKTPNTVSEQKALQSETS